MSSGTTPIHRSDRPDFARTSIGSVAVPAPDITRGFPVPSIVAIDLASSARVYGAPGGYPSVDQARAAAAHLTLGHENPSAAILEREDRFFLQGVDESTWTQVFRGQDDVSVVPFRFEGVPSADLAGVTIRSPEVRFLIDGATTIGA